MARAQRPPRTRAQPRPAARSERRAARPARQRQDDRRPARRRSDLLARILVALPAAVLALGLVDIGGTAWAVFMIVLAWMCLYELYRLLGRWRPVEVVGFAAAAAMILAARFGTQRDVLEAAVIALPVAFLLVAARGGGRLASVSIAGTLLGVWWVGIAFAHAELLRRLPHGTGVLIDIMVGTFLGDTAAYLGGRLFGRRPLAPAISPNKTVEGLFCGMLIAILSIYIAGLNETWLTPGDALLLGVAVAIVGPIGDLFESLVKRDAGAKDAGGAFGAHGGALDRLDAVMFTVVAGYYVWIAVPHLS